MYRVRARAVVVVPKAINSSKYYNDNGESVRGV